MCPHEDPLVQGLRSLAGPSVPVASAGAGESLLVLDDGQRAAVGLSNGAVALLSYLGLQTKLRITVLAPTRPLGRRVGSGLGDRVVDRSTRP